MSDPEPVDEQYTEIRGGNRPADFVPASQFHGRDEYEQDDEDDHDKANR